MTKQEIFDTVAKHLLTQNAKSESWVEGSASCMYRGDDGRMCAAGALIKDEFYSGKLELRLTTESPVIEALQKSGVPMHEPGVPTLIRILQRVHDEFPTDLWAVELRAVAFAHRLDDKVVP